VVAETARQWPMPRDVTADFMYLRLHGDQEIYRSGYRPAAIARWAERIAIWREGGEPEHLPEGAVRVTSAPESSAPAGRDVFCYFDNTDVKLRAPQDAQALMRRLDITVRRAGRPALRIRPKAPVLRAADRATVRNSATDRRLRG